MDIEPERDINEVQNWDILQDFQEEIKEIPKQAFENWFNALVDETHRELNALAPIYQKEYVYEARTVKFVYHTQLILMGNEMKDFLKEICHKNFCVIMGVDLDYKQAPNKGKQSVQKAKENVILRIILPKSQERPVLNNEENYYSALLIKTMDWRCNLQEQIEFLMKKLRAISTKEKYNQYYGLVTDLNRMSFFKYCKQSQKCWQSKEFIVDIKKEYFDCAKSEEIKTLYRLIVSIIIRSMRSQVI